MSSVNLINYDKEAIRERVTLPGLAAAEGVEVRRQGNRWVGRCPFHAERTPSFSMTEREFHCFGCGAGGDVFDFWAMRRGLDARDKGHWSQILAELAGVAGVGPQVLTMRPKPVASAPRQTLADRGKPWLPEMRLLREEEIEQLARLRGIGNAAIYAAEENRRVGWCMWPQRQGVGIDSRSVASWVITDDARWCAQWRTMSGKPYSGANGEMKSWSTRNTSWVIGCEEIRQRPVILVEGGADMLAAYHLLTREGMEEDVAVCCLFGASNAMAPESLVHFEGVRVRIFADNDRPRVRQFRGKAPISVRPGWEAASRWQRQLESAGARVDVLDFGPCGEDVKDLNDWVRQCYDSGVAREMIPAADVVAA